MKKFELIYQEVQLPDGSVNLKIYPEDLSISDYICTYQTLSSNEDVLTFVATFISEMKPLLFERFQTMENIPQEVRAEFEL